MSWTDFNSYIYGVLSASVAAIIILVRKVLTNEKKVELLEKEIALRDLYNKDRIEKMEVDLKEIRSDIKLLIGRN